MLDEDICWLGVVARRERLLFLPGSQVGTGCCLVESITQGIVPGYHLPCISTDKSMVAISAAWLVAGTEGSAGGVFGGPQSVENRVPELLTAEMQAKDGGGDGGWW